MTKKLIFIVGMFFWCAYVSAAIELYLPPPEIGSEDLKQFETWKSAYRGRVETQSHKVQDGNKYLNELVLSESPYLAQHSTNPINWKPWSQDLLNKAKQENKLIFLSIGYSTCHWCHVMRDESFTDISIAKEVNAKFYSIKVDREELPHVDEYYMRALQQVKGEAGWPITAIINGDGLPVFIDSYLPKEKLLKLLPRISQIWQQQPDFLLLTAKKIDSLINQKIDSVKEINSNDDLLNSINDKLISLLDEKNGGFSGEVKFPSEAMLFYALDQLKRMPNQSLQKLLKLQLDNMILNGIYDHVGGGFHRYSTDPTWQVPHFEKMLYNQAQLIMVYSLAYEYFLDPKYLRVIQQTTELLLSEFVLNKHGFVSAFDADFQGKEGAYYVWSKQELESLGIKKSEYQTYPIDGSNKFGILLASAADETRTKLLSARKQRGNIYFDKKILTSWNALTIKSLVYAGKVLKNDAYIKQAINLAERFWAQRFNDKSGHLARTGYSSLTKNGEKHLDDYAFLADAFLTIYDYSDDQQWLDRAKRLTSEAINYFSDGEGAFSNISNKSGKFASYKMSDSELLSPSAMMNDVIFQLDKRLGKKTTSNTYSKQKSNLVANIATQPLSHLYAALVLNNIKNGSQRSTRYFAAANGKVDLHCSHFDETGCVAFDLDISLKKGWHINSNKPLQDYLMATQMDVPSGFFVEYPESKIVTLGFQPEALSVFEDNIKIRIIKKNKTLEKHYLNLPLQACNERVCLLPETLNFMM